MMIRGNAVFPAASTVADLPIMESAAAQDLWPLDPQVVFLNHGSFGSCPLEVLQFQNEIRARMEREPIDFFVRDLEGLLDRARGELAEFVGAQPDNLVFVPNATAGVNTVLRSLQFRPGDELLVTNHEYNACRNALNVAAERSGVAVRVVEIPFPIASDNEVVDRIISASSGQTRLILVDHVTSQTGLVLPVERIVAQAVERGIETLIDGAHAPGMIPLNLERLGATYYTGNCHKWICAPKGAGFLFVQPGRQREIRPLSVSHGANSPRTDRSRFLIEFGWTGTWDPSAYLSVPVALRWMAKLGSNGWSGVMRRNRALALAGRKLLCQALRQPEPAPEGMIGSLASLILPPGSTELPVSPLYMDALQEKLRADYSIEVPVVPWPHPPQRLLRISAQMYNFLGQYERLAAALERCGL